MPSLDFFFLSLRPNDFTSMQSIALSTLFLPNIIFLLTPCSSMLCSLNTGKFSLSGDLMHAILLACHTNDPVALEQVEGGSCQGPHRDWVLFEGAGDWFDYRLL